MGAANPRTRRDFLAEMAAAGSALLLDIPLIIAQQRMKSSNSTVAIARDDSVRLQDGSLKRDKVRKLLSLCMHSVTGKNNDADAWKQLFSPDDTVGIKVNCLAGRELSTNPEIVQAIIEGLNSAGVKSESIIVWDRTDNDLRKAGYTISTSRQGWLCFGTNDGYDYNLGIVNASSIGSLFSPILTKMCNAIISVPVLKDHDLAGLSGTMKNFYGAIHNPNKYHDNGCNPYVADIMAVPFVRNKLRLTIYDATNVQYHGGPSHKQKWCWHYNGLMASTDFVSADAVAYKIIDDKRIKENMKSLRGSGREPLYISSASEKKLGRSKLEDIEVIYI